MAPTSTRAKAGWGRARSGGQRPKITPMPSRALIELGADVNAKSKVLSFPEFKWSTSGMVSTALPRGGWTPLMHAARQGALEAGTALAEAPQVDLNVVDPDGTTALVVAIINAHYDFAAMLLDKGADPNVADTTGTAALYFLVDMHTLGDMQGRPAPKLVDAIDAEGLLKKLIAKGANPNARLLRPMLGRYHGSGDATLGEGTTPFLRAAKAVDVPFMRALLEGGADPTLTKKDRTNAAMLVAAGQANAGYLGPGPGCGALGHARSTADVHRSRRGHQCVQHDRADSHARRGRPRARRRGEVPCRTRRQAG